jgi:hypothetical protein
MGQVSGNQASGFYPSQVPAPLLTGEKQLKDAPSRDHDQDVLSILIAPAATYRLDQVNTALPGETQWHDLALLIKMCGDFDSLHDNPLMVGDKI